MAKKTKILLSIFLLLLLVFFVSLSYVYGQPLKDKIMPWSKIYFIDRLNEIIYTLSSVSTEKRANKEIALLEERFYEYIAATSSQNQNKINLAVSNYNCQMKHSFNTIKNIKDQKTRNQLYVLLFNQNIKRIASMLENKNFPAKDLDTSITILNQTLKNLPAESQKNLINQNLYPLSLLKNSAESSQKLLDGISGDLTSLIPPPTGPCCEEGSGQKEEEKAPQSEPPASQYFPITAVTREEIEGLIGKEYNGKFELREINVIKAKSFLSANVAIAENMGGLFIIKKTKAGLAIAEIYTEDDLSTNQSYFENIGEEKGFLPKDYLTWDEWLWLVSYMPEEDELAITYK